MSQISIVNKKARFEYHIEETFEAGMVLVGSEVKSLRDKAAQLKESYVVFKNDEAFVQGMHISPYKSSSHFNHEPLRLRKLLLHAKELIQIQRALKEKGLSCIPMKVYIKQGKFKMLIGLGRGKKAHDKREDIKKREQQKDLDRGMSRK